MAPPPLARGEQQGGPERLHHDSTDGIALPEDLLEDLRRLSPRQRAVLVLRYLDDLTEPDTAAARGIFGGDCHVARPRRTGAAAPPADRRGVASCYDMTPCVLALGVTDDARRWHPVSGPHGRSGACRYRRCHVCSGRYRCACDDQGNVGWAGSSARWLRRQSGSGTGQRNVHAAEERHEGPRQIASARSGRSTPRSARRTRPSHRASIVMVASQVGGRVVRRSCRVEGDEQDRCSTVGWSAGVPGSLVGGSVVTTRGVPMRPPTSH